MSLTDRQVLHTARMGQVICFSGAKGYSIKVLEWNRLPATQQHYVDIGASKTLDSRHIDNLATDFVLVVNGAAVFLDENSPQDVKDAYRAIGQYGESLGLRWGGRFVNHAEFKEKHGRDFDPSKDFGWDSGHLETTVA